MTAALDPRPPHEWGLQKELHLDCGLDLLQHYLALETIEHARQAHPAEFAAAVRQLGLWHVQAGSALASMKAAISQIEQWGKP